MFLLLLNIKLTLLNIFYYSWTISCLRVRVLKLVAVKEEREEILKNHLKEGKFDVCVTSYEGANICKNNL